MIYQMLMKMQLFRQRQQGGWKEPRTLKTWTTSGGPSSGIILFQERLSPSSWIEEPFQSGFTKQELAGVIFDGFGKEWEYHISHYTEEEMEESIEEDDSLMDHNTPSETPPDESPDEEPYMSSHPGTQTEVQVDLEETSSSDSDEAF